MEESSSSLTTSTTTTITTTMIRPIIPILRKITQLSEQFSFDGSKKEYLRKEICSIVSQINTNVLEIQFPQSMPPLPVNVLCGNVYRDLTKFDCGIFAFPQTGNKLPLHDHPNMEGFIKVLTGKLLVTSFSLLDSEEEKILRREKALEANERIKPARFEGTHLLVAPSSEVACLNSFKGNIHSIESVEGFGAFFDLLIPGYDQSQGSVPCTYFQCDEQNPTIGKIYWLRIIPDNNCIMGELKLPSIYNFHLS